MDRIEKHLTSIRQCASSESSKPLPKIAPSENPSTENFKWTKESLERFWTFMGTTYGATWFTQNGLDPPRPWVLFLKTITPQHARTIVERCLEESKYIPTLATFIHFNKFKPQPELNEHGLDYVPQHLRPEARKPAALPKPLANKSVAEENLRKMREAIGVEK